MAGRPKIHINRADKQHAYRQRKRAERDNELEQLAAWQRVRTMATTSGVLLGDESDFIAAQKLCARIEQSIEQSSDAIFPL